MTLSLTMPTQRWSPPAEPATVPPVEDPADRVDMAAYVAGDAAAFSRLFRAYSPRLHRFFLRSFRDRTVADELLQITFLHVHKARASYREGSPVSPWIFTIAANARRDQHRKHLRRKEDLGEDALDALLSDEPAADDFEDRDLAEQVRAAVDALPEPQRAVVQLHRFEGFTFPEIARILSLKEVAVRVRASRAYERLRERLGGLAQRGGAG